MKFLIIIPAHNEEENILPCLESLKNQTFQDFKCVIVNDGSTDKTQEIVEILLKCHAERSRSVKFLLNLENPNTNPAQKS